MTPAENAPAIVRTRAVATGHWRAFLAVAKHLNFRAAADELALTQSAVSRQIQALEDEVGVPLFLRHTRAVELTSAGAQLHRAVGPAIERMDAAVRQRGAGAWHPGGRCRSSRVSRGCCTLPKAGCG